MARFEIADEFIDVDVENDLTKAIFGGFQLLSADALNEVFAGSPFDFSFDSTPEFTFHETIHRREPDVVITDEPNLAILVEAKLGGSTDPSQLADEYADLTQYYDTNMHRLVHMTKTRSRPEDTYSQTDIPSEDLIWTNWRQLAATLMDVKKDPLSTTEQRIIGLILQVFESNGFAPFNGFTMNEFNSLSDQLEQAYQVRSQYYDDINSFRKSVETHLTDDIEFWRFFRRGVKGGLASGVESFPDKEYERIPRNIWFSYIPVAEGEPDRAENKYQENYLLLDFNSKTGAVRAGYVMTTAPYKVENDVFRRRLHEKKETVLEIVETTDFQPFTTSYSLGAQIESIDEFEKFLEDIGDEEYNIDRGKRVMIARVWTADELPVREEGADGRARTRVTEKVADAIDELHRITHQEHDGIFYPTG